MNSENSAVIQLVDSASGIYSYNSLAVNYPLFIEENDNFILFETWLKTQSGFEDDTIYTVFNPENDQWCENIDWFTNNGLYVKSENDYWRIDDREGDIVAVNPLAEWDDENEQYTMQVLDNDLLANRS